MSGPVDVLGILRQFADSDGLPYEAFAAVAELVSKADRVAATLESPALVRQSNKNANAGFIDWRDWCALKGEVMAIRAALAKFGGAA